MKTESSLIRCPACGTRYDPATSDAGCPHGWRAAEPAGLRALREAGPPYKVESWLAKLPEEGDQDMTPTVRDLLSLIATPDVRNPKVYTCRGCGMPYRAAEGHDYGACDARRKEAERCHSATSTMKTS